MAKKSENTTQITEKQAKKALNANKKKAEQLLQNDKEMNKFLDQVGDKIGMVSGLKDKIKDIPLIVSLIKAYIHKEYREIPVGSLIGLIASLIYFLSPIDLIPDLLPGIGYIDDFTVIAIAIRFAYTDIEDFKKWQQEQEQKDSEKEELQLDDEK